MDSLRGGFASKLSGVHQSGSSPVEHTDSPKGEATKHLEAFTTSITEALKGGEEVQLPGFGKFYVREQKAREGKNPQTGERMQIEARKVPAFKAGKAFKESV